MARVWVVVREGLKLVGAVVGEVPLEPAAARVDLAPWRLFTTRPPEPSTPEYVRGSRERKRVLVEVRDEDRHELCGFVLGFFESPYSWEECERRLAGVASASRVDVRL